MELRRRTVLGAAAAAGLLGALPGCTADAPPIRGRLVGPSAARGHLLRDGVGERPVVAEESAGVVIVGGGVAGLSAAWKLAREGFDDFVLLELEDTVGGTSVAGSNDVSAYPWGAHYLPVPLRSQRALCRLLEEMDLVDGTFDGHGRARASVDHLCRSPQERVFYRGAWGEGLYVRAGSSEEDRRQFHAFHEEVQRLVAYRDSGGRRAFALPIAHSSQDPELLELDAISMARWMDERGFDSPRLRWYVEYGCRDDYGCLLEHTSAWAGLHYFCSRIGDPGDEGAEFLTWPEGNARLVAHLAQSARGKVRAGAVVTEVDPSDDGVRVRYLNAETDALHEVTAQQVVCALPRFVARRVVRGLPADSESFHYSPWVVANLTLRSQPTSRGFPLCWDNVLVESESLGYVVATHQSDRPGRGSVWTWYRPYCEPDAAAARTRLRSRTWEEFRDEILADLRRGHADIAEHVESIDVWRWGHAMIRPEVGFLWGPARRRAVEPLGGVHFAGADVGGLPLFEEAQWSGVRAAEEVLAALGVPHESWL